LSQNRGYVRHTAHRDYLPKSSRAKLQGRVASPAVCGYGVMDTLCRSGMFGVNTGYAPGSQADMTDQRIKKVSGAL
jgi:hypothetical protein